MLRPNGLTKAACLLIVLPEATSSQVLAELDPAVALQLSKVMSRVAQLPPKILSALTRWTFREVFLETATQPEDQSETWLSLARSDPTLAANVCLHHYRAQDSVKHGE